MNNRDAFEKLVFRTGDLVYLLPCVDVTLYWSGSHFEMADGIVEFYKRSLALIRDSVKFYRTETMGAARRIKKDTFNLVPLWFKETKTKRDVYSLFLESGAVADEPSDRAFALDCTPGTGSVRLILPVSFADDVPRYLALALELGNVLPFDSGHAGYSVNWNHLGRTEMDAVDAMNGLTRYPGLDLSHQFITKFNVTKGIKCANWLTFLSDAYTDRIGGPAKLSKSFSKDIVVHRLPHGAAIQAGPAPEIGDVNRRQTLPAYRQVGKVVAPLRVKPHPAIFGPRGFGDLDVTEKWLSRFDS